ncbi:reverse transcriptase family protein [Chondromyces apiculatus]|uniref:RNA-directed DNA polymerase n=1 Tax=Chondromyces apiculatus DSM 436 TaxID=1192034 RepID=A0A017TBZ3_9BACT|nr:reverse transcriptase family protein [Chondromyces apiculatus]EYF06432.1 Retron-type RNA-directed DNA polymerase [Chondromyces apiculatus DSM 436]
MSFWDRVKAFFGGGKGEGTEAPPYDAPTQRAPAQRAATKGTSGSGTKASQGAATSTSPAASGAPAASRRTFVKWITEAFSTDPAVTTRAIMSMSAAEIRRRALTINPFRTAWIGRVDVIPPQSDERTALIDRSLILLGLLTEEQIVEIHRVGDLWLKHREASRLVALSAARNAEQALADLKRERAARKEQKRRDAVERRRKRAEAIARRRAEDIVYLGAGVSAGLADRRSHIEALAARGLPLLASPADVAKALGVSISRLRWLCFHSDAVERPHYVYFEIPKRSGGKRLLAAPHASLERAQHWILREILDKLPVEPPAHGFVKGRSTVTNARPHVGRDLVVNLDLSDFFPTITFPRVRGVFRRLGYSPAVATVLALLCTEPPRRPVEYEGQRTWVAVGERGLPQGASTSPALSNQVARKLDRRLTGMAEKHGWTYTRYADDLTFSAPEGRRGDLAMLMARVRHIVTEEGFALNPRKGRVQRASGRQEVTGIVVNDKLGVPRDEVRRLRAILHAAKATGLEAQNREKIPHFEAYLRGKIAYVAMIDPAKAAPLHAALEALSR